jgi:hypothetical protein
MSRPRREAGSGDSARRLLLDTDVWIWMVKGDRRRLRGPVIERIEEAGHVTVRTSFRDRKPLTRYALTGKGREALRTHLDTLDALVRGADSPPDESIDE